MCSPLWLGSLSRKWQKTRCFQRVWPNEMGRQDAVTPCPCLVTVIVLSSSAEGFWKLEGAPTYSSAVCVVIALLFLEVIFQALDHRYDPSACTTLNFTSAVLVLAYVCFGIFWTSRRLFAEQMFFACVTGAD